VHRQKFHVLLWWN